MVKILFDFYLDASIHVAFAVLAFYHVTLLNFNIPETKNLNYVIFLSTVITYNFIKYGSRAKSYVIVTVKYEKIIQGISFFAGIFLCYFLIGLSVINLIILAFLAWLCLLSGEKVSGRVIEISSFPSNLMTAPSAVTTITYRPAWWEN